MRYCFESDRMEEDPASGINRVPRCAGGHRGQSLLRLDDPAARRELSYLAAEVWDHQRFGVKYSPEMGAAQVRARDLDGTPFVVMLEFSEEAD